MALGMGLGLASSKSAGRDLAIACPTITPTWGTERLSDGGMESWTTATNLLSWTEAAAGASSITQSQADPHGGSSSALFAVDVADSAVSIRASVPYSWVRITGWIKGNGTISVRDTDRVLGSAAGTGSWASFGLVTRFTSGIVRFLASGANATVALDDASAREFDFTTATYLLGDLTRQTGSFRCAPTVAVGTQAGILINAANAQNYVHLYLDRAGATDRAVLLKVVGGTPTEVVVGDVTYSAGAVLRVAVVGTNYTMSYDGVAVGTTQAIATTGLGTKVYGFSTDAANAVGAVITSISAS